MVPTYRNGHKNQFGLRQGSSPIIIVVNKRDLNHGYEFDINRYRKHFNIVDVLYLSAADDQTIDDAVRKKISHNINDLTDSIEEHLAALDDIQFPLPSSWLKVKTALERMSDDAKDFIENDDYENLCIAQGIEQDILQSTLLTILNQIGTIVTYKNHHRLSVIKAS